MTVLRTASHPGPPVARLPLAAGLCGEQIVPPLWLLDSPLRGFLELPAVPAAVGIARRHARGLLHDWHMPGSADTIELLVSEIITNAVCASASLAGQRGMPASPPPVRFWLTSARRLIMINVWDADPRQPGGPDAGPDAGADAGPDAGADAGPDAETGRGLLLVSALSAHWGYHALAGQAGKIVWAVCGT